MKIDHLDHLVLTTANLDACLAFYQDILGMQVSHENNRYALHFGQHRMVEPLSPSKSLPPQRQKAMHIFHAHCLVLVTLISYPPSFYTREQ